jgi:hypothetical protein
MDAQISTAGAVSVHINSNEMTDADTSESWVDFDCRWKDDSWHHLAVTWDYDSGDTKLYLDGARPGAACLLPTQPPCPQACVAQVQPRGYGSGELAMCRARSPLPQACRRRPSGAPTRAGWRTRTRPRAV